MINYRLDICVTDKNNNKDNRCYFIDESKDKLLTLVEDVKKNLKENEVVNYSICVDLDNYKYKRMDTILKIKRLNKDAILPSYAHVGDAGMDITSIVDATLQPGDQKVITTGFAIQLEPGYEAQIRPRSGLASKFSIGVTNSPGTIDSGYTGECKVILINLGQNTYHVAKGDRIAQMVINKLPSVEIVVVDDFTATERGDNGFGSTGK